LIASNASDDKLSNQLRVIEDSIGDMQERIYEAMNTGQVGRAMQNLQTEINKLDIDDPERTKLEGLMQEKEAQVTQAISGDSIKVLIQLRKKLMEDIGMAPSVGGAGGSGSSSWGQAKKI
jgi:hypothetical protein